LQVLSGATSLRLSVPHLSSTALKPCPNAQLTSPARARRAQRRLLPDVPEPSIGARLDSQERSRRRPAIESEGRTESSCDTNSTRRDLRPPTRQVAGALCEQAVRAPAPSPSRVAEADRTSAGARPQGDRAARTGRSPGSSTQHRRQPRRPVAEMHRIAARRRPDADPLRGTARPSDQYDPRRIRRRQARPASQTDEQNTAETSRPSSLTSRRTW
jgi:hypothetical protein